LQTDIVGNWLTITYRSLETVVTIPASLEGWRRCCNLLMIFNAKVDLAVPSASGSPIHSPG
jgi:hypothetical protein